MRTAVRYVAGAVALALAAGGCTAGERGGEPATPSPSVTASRSDGTASPPPEERPAGDVLRVRHLPQGEDVAVELTALDRVSPQRVVARWRVRNDTDRPYKFGATLAVPWNSPRLHSNSIGGVSLLDHVNGTRAYPLGYGDDSCLCTRGWPSVEAHATKELVAVFPAPPAGVTRVDVLFGPVPPFLDVPIGTAAPERLRVTDGDDEPVDPMSVRATEPQVLRLVSQVDDAAKARDDDGERLSLRLSADVLFAVNKATLTSRAQVVLREVAAEIDRSDGATVTVEGHADSTGTDAVNDPLSAERARSVEKALRELVTRDGVSYEARGHGSRRPVAKNDNAAGRRLNRRVTVSFDRPAAEPGPSDTAAPRTATPQPAMTGKDLPVIATAPAGAPPPYESDWPRQADVRVNELRRDAGGYVLLTWTVHNRDDLPLNVWTSSKDSSGLYEESSTTAITLEAGDRRYRTVRDADARVAIGPDLQRLGLDDYTVEKGEQYTLWAMFKPPADVSRVTVRIPGFEPVSDVPIS
ncbi:OmpA family protein [Nonomuraea sp. B1E8]|uniref:OmpA family protein n=1 Tax=unclassified Nonomuraea TaxID=2593643 RepID=UPI00325E4A9F